VINPKCRRFMREALNLESGLNDGICVPIVVLLLGLAVGTEIERRDHGACCPGGAEAIGLGAVIGLGLTWCTTLMLRFAERRGWISEHWVEIPIVALAAACFAAAAGSSPALSVAYCGAGCAAAAQGGAAARRRAHGRCAGAADMGRVSARMIDPRHLVAQHPAAESRRRHVCRSRALCRRERFRLVVVGAAFVDVDLDGWEDLLIGTGHVTDVMDGDTQYRQRNLISGISAGLCRGWTGTAFCSTTRRFKLPNVAFRNRGRPDVRGCQQEVAVLSGR